MVSSFGATRPRNIAIRFVEDTPKVLAPPARALDGTLAREAIVLRVGDVEQVEVEVERQARPRGGAQGYWRCPEPSCGRRCCALFIVECDGRPSLRCRKCARVDYKVRHVSRNCPAVFRAGKIRQRLGAQVGMLSPLPPRPRHNMQAARYDRLARALAEQEAIVSQALGGIVRALKRRKGRLHGPR